MAKAASPLKATASTAGEPRVIDSTSSAAPVVLDDLPADPANAAQKYQLWIWAANTDTVRRLLTVVLGTVQVTMWVPPQSGLSNLVVPGIAVLGPLKVSAFADNGSVIYCSVARKPLLTDAEFQP